MPLPEIPKRDFRSACIIMPSPESTNANCLNSNFMGLKKLLCKIMSVMPEKQSWNRLPQFACKPLTGVLCLT